jgi:GAF domain-containing protein
MNIPIETQRLCAMLEHAELDRDTFLNRCARLVAEAIGCSRAGIWIFVDTMNGRILRCLAMYDGIGDRMTSVADQPGDHVGVYFQILEQVGYVIATDASEHFATAGFFAEHLKPNGVQSMMAVSFSVNGKLYGAFTCTQVGVQLEWGRPQLNVLRQIGSRVSLAMATHAARTALDTRPATLLD